MSAAEENLSFISREDLERGAPDVGFDDEPAGYADFVLICAIPPSLRSSRSKQHNAPAQTRTTSQTGAPILLNFYSYDLLWCRQTNHPVAVVFHVLFKASAVCSARHAVLVPLDDICYTYNFSIGEHSIQ